LYSCHMYSSSVAPRVLQGVGVSGQCRDNRGAYYFSGFMHSCRIRNTHPSDLQWCESESVLANAVTTCHPVVKNSNFVSTINMLVAANNK
jgi:hypothetical protein